MTDSNTVEGRPSRSFSALTAKLLPVALLLLLAPIRPAHAYIDPNAAGPLYQMLFPLLVAIGSGIAMMRRYLRQLWNRAAAAILGVFRRGSIRDDGGSMS